MSRFSDIQPRRFFIIAFLLSFCAGMLVPTLSFAQKRYDFASAEDIAIAFYKTGKTVPNFEKWIKERGPYNATPAARRDRMLKKETARLRAAYSSFNPEENFLNIRTSVRVTPEVIDDEPGSEMYAINTEFIEAPEALYFPYDFLGERIVVMPYKLETLLKSELTKDEYGYLSTVTKPEDRNSMIIKLKAREADMTRPYRIDGIDQWVLKADIVSMVIMNKQGGVLWTYSAPWYVDPAVQEVKKLYENKADLPPKTGSFKPLNYGKSK